MLKRCISPTVIAIAMLTLLQASVAAQASDAGPAVATPPTGKGTAPARLTGSWKSEVERLMLTTDFDKSVWGPNAASLRDVELIVQPNGQATLRVTRKVVDGRGRTVAASTSVEEAEIEIGEPQPTPYGRTDYAVTVVRAERRYPDDPKDRWPLEGLRVKLATIDNADSNAIEVRVETPEGKGSFWETLRRQPRPAARRTTG